MNDDFYVGYDAFMPVSLAGRIRVAAAALIVLALVVSGVLVLAQGRFAKATFEYGQTRTFEGRLVEYPYPALVVSRSAGTTTYWVVGAGKHGAFNLVKGRDGQMVRMSGSVIERDHDRMIEVPSSEAIVSIDSHAVAPLEPLRSLGPIVVRGEIVDSKCHLGVMKPGEGATHRDCAVRCLLGRITPMFAPSHHDTRVGRLPLVDRRGEPIDDSFETLAGRPVEIRGELFARGPLRFLATDTSAILAIRHLD